MPVDITADILNTHLPNWTWVGDGRRVVGTPDGEPVEEAPIAVRVHCNGRVYSTSGYLGDRIDQTLLGETVAEVISNLRDALEGEAEWRREEAARWVEVAEMLESAAQNTNETEATQCL